MSLIQEFKTFVSKGNVIDLAVGVIIGAAFGKIVDSMVKDVITPIIGLVGGQPDFSSFALGAHEVVKDGVTIREGGIMIGNFLNSVVSFLILAAVAFFVLVKPMNHLMARMAPKADPPPAGPPPATLDDVVAAIKDLKK